MPGFHRPTGTGVPAHGGAGVVGARALAAQAVQAPALLRALVVEGLGEQALVIEGPAVAAVVDGLTEEGHGPVVLVEFRELAEDQVLGQDPGDDHGQGRAAGDVDDRLVLDHIHHRHGAGGVGVGHGQTAEGGTGADGDHRLGPGHHFHQRLIVADAGDGGVARVGVGPRQGAVHDEQILAVVLLDRLVAGGLGLMPGGGLQRFLVVQGDDVEDQVLHRGREAAGEGFDAAGALLEGQPDHRRPSRLLQGGRDGRGHGRRQRHHRGGGGTELEEAAARHPMFS